MAEKINDTYKGRLNTIKQKEEIHMKPIPYATIVFLLLMFLVVGQSPIVLALEGESLKANVPQESSKALKDATPSESLSDDDDAKGPCPPAYIKLVSPRAAKVGDTISIQGWRFGDDEGQVMFPSGIPADISSWRNQRIEVTVPEGAKTGNITVTTACGSNNKPGAGSYFKVMEKQTEK
jgi:hypothetical protein